MIPQATEKVKRDYIGSGHIAGVMRVDGAFSSQLAIARELKTGESNLDMDDLPEPVALGIELEPYVLKAYARAERAEILMTQPHYRYPGWDCLGATPDALVKGADGALRLVDAKVVGDWKWDEVPLKYEASSQWQIGIAGEVLGVRECDLAVYFLPARRLKVFRVTANPEWFDDAADYAIEFYRRYVIGSEIPPADGHRSTSEALKKLQASIGKVINIDDHVNLIAELEEAGAVLKAAEERRDTARNMLCAVMGDAEIGLVDGKPRFTWKAQQGRESLDQKALKADHPEIYEQYVRRGASFRVPRILKGK